MLDLTQISDRVAMGKPSDFTAVDLGFLAQVVAEIEEGRKAKADLALHESREGMTFAARQRL
jgi:hypothetical protein